MQAILITSGNKNPKFGEDFVIPLVSLLKDWRTEWVKLPVCTSVHGRSFMNIVITGTVNKHRFIGINIVNICNYCHGEYHTTDTVRSLVSTRVITAHTQTWNQNNVQLNNNKNQQLPSMQENLTHENKDKTWIVWTCRTLTHNRGTKDNTAEFVWTNTHVYEAINSWTQAHKISSDKMILFC